jgi:hypothetical protein
MRLATIITLIGGLIAMSTHAKGQQDIRPKPGGERLLCIDADGQSIRKTPNGTRLLFLDADGQTIRKEPSGPRLLFVDADSVREQPGGVRLAFLDGKDIRRSPGSPVLYDYTHPDLSATAHSNREFFIDGAKLSNQQLVGVLYLLKPKLFELSSDEQAALKKEMEENAAAEDKRLAADRAVGTFEILTAYNAPARSGRIVVAPKKGDSYQLKWSHKEGPEWTGTGVQFVEQDGDRWLWVALGAPGTTGLGVFEIKEGELKGKWYNALSDQDPKNTGTETLNGPKDLNGEFAITEAKAPATGAPYTGKVTIKPLEVTFDNDFHAFGLTWDFGGKTIKGVGLRTKEGKLYVAAGTGEVTRLGAFKLDTDGTMVGDFLTETHEKGYYTNNKVNE